MDFGNLEIDRCRCRAGHALGQDLVALFTKLGERRALEVADRAPGDVLERNRESNWCACDADRGEEAFLSRSTLNNRSRPERCRVGLKGYELTVVARLCVLGVVTEELILLHRGFTIIIAGKLGLPVLETAHPVAELTSGISEARNYAKKVLMKDIPAPGDGLQALVSLFSTCIGCRGCREACPLCNCVLCDYETARTLHSPELVRAEAKRKGSQRVPAGTLHFQLGRLMHIAPLCTACGQCSDVCPVDIPVADIFIRAANLVQESLDYAPGRDIDDSPPMATYVEKELLDITD